MFMKYNLKKFPLTYSAVRNAVFDHNYLEYAD